MLAESSPANIISKNNIRPSPLPANMDYSKVPGQQHKYSGAASNHPATATRHDTSLAEGSAAHVHFHRIQSLNKNELERLYASCLGHTKWWTSADRRATTEYDLRVLVHQQANKMDSTQFVARLEEVCSDTAFRSTAAAKPYIARLTALSVGRLFYLHRSVPGIDRLAIDDWDNPQGRPFCRLLEQAIQLGEDKFSSYYATATTTPLSSIIASRHPYIEDIEGLSTAQLSVLYSQASCRAMLPPLISLGSGTEFTIELIHRLAEQMGNDFRVLLDHVTGSVSKLELCPSTPTPMPATVGPLESQAVREQDSLAVEICNDKDDYCYTDATEPDNTSEERSSSLREYIHQQAVELGTAFKPRIEEIEHQTVAQSFPTSHPFALEVQDLSREQLARFLALCCTTKTFSTIHPNTGILSLKRWRRSALLDAAHAIAKAVEPDTIRDYLDQVLGLYSSHRAAPMAPTSTEQQHTLTERINNLSKSELLQLHNAYPGTTRQTYTSSTLPELFSRVHRLSHIADLAVLIPLLEEVEQNRTERGRTQPIQIGLTPCPPSKIADTVPLAFTKEQRLSYNIYPPAMIQSERNESVPADWCRKETVPVVVGIVEGDNPVMDQDTQQHSHQASNPTLVGHTRNMRLAGSGAKRSAALHHSNEAAQKRRRL